MDGQTNGRTDERTDGRTDNEFKGVRFHWLITCMILYAKKNGKKYAFAFADLHFYTKLDIDLITQKSVLIPDKLNWKDLKPAVLSQVLKPVVTQSPPSPRSCIDPTEATLRSPHSQGGGPA